MEKKAFVLGMITAFCECVAAGCKPLALSPPLSGEDFESLEKEITALIAAHGLLCFHEENLDLPPAERVHWMIVYAEPDALVAYLTLRAEGKNPMHALDAFAEVLGYGPNRIHTGFDAYAHYFG